MKIPPSRILFSVFIFLTISINLFARSEISEETDEVEYGKIDTIRKGPIQAEFIARLNTLKTDSIPLDIANELFLFLKKRSDTSILISRADIARIDIDDDGVSEMLIHLDAEYISDRYYLFKKEIKSWYVVANFESHGSYFDAVPDPAYEWNNISKTLIIPYVSGWGTDAYIFSEKHFYRWQNNNLQNVLKLVEIHGANSPPFDYGSYNYYETEYRFLTKDTLLLKHTYSEVAPDNTFPSRWKIEEESDLNILYFEIEIPYVYNTKYNVFLPETTKLAHKEKEFYKIFQLETLNGKTSDTLLWKKWEDMKVAMKQYLRKTGNKYQKFYLKHENDNFEKLRKRRKDE